MQYWICLTSLDNWDKIEKENIWGVEERALKQIMKTVPGDKLIFYLKNPVKAIVGIYEAKSSMYVDRRNLLWKNQLYPYRIRIEPIRRVSEIRTLTGSGNLLSLSEIMGKVTSFRSLSALQGKSMVAITAAEFRMMNSLLAKRLKSKV